MRSRADPAREPVVGPFEPRPPQLRLATPGDNVPRRVGLGWRMANLGMTEAEAGDLLPAGDRRTVALPAPTVHRERCCA